MFNFLKKKLKKFEKELKEEIQKEVPNEVQSVFISSLKEEGLTELKDVLWQRLNN